MVYVDSETKTTWVDQKQPGSTTRTTWAGPDNLGCICSPIHIRALSTYEKSPKPINACESKQIQTKS